MNPPNWAPRPAPQFPARPRTAMLSLVVGALMIGLAGCNGAAPKPKRAAQVAVAVSVTDGQAPNAAQLASIHRALAPEIAKRGLTVVQNSEAAEYVLAVRFTPDRLTPDGGHVTIIGLQPKAGRQGPSLLESMRAEGDVVHQRVTAP